MNDLVIAVVVTFKRKEFLTQILDNLTKQTFPLAEIVVIDNNSQDGTQELVKELIEAHKSSTITYYNTGENLGGAGGFAFGFNAVKSRRYNYLWLMDDDLLPELSCLENLVNTNGNGIVQPMRFNLDGTCAEISPIEYDLSSIFLINPKKSTVKQIYEQKTFEEPIAIAGIPFEGPLISRDVIDSVGIPEARFFIFNDDLDYSIRTRNAGYSILCQPSARATRLLVNNQSSDLGSWKGYFMLRNHFYILRTHGANFLVRLRPLLLTAGYFMLSIFRGQFNSAFIALKAYRDSFTLKNNKKYRP